MVSEFDRLNCARVAGAVSALAVLLMSTPVRAQTGTTPPAQTPAAQSTGGVTTTVTVTAQKEPANAQTLPLSVTVVDQQRLNDADVRFVNEAGIYAPNTIFTEFTARKLSNARFRGVGASPANPGITTFIDGVPQLNANSSSLEFIDVQQAEFVRGSQSSLFGRNTLGGLINLTSAPPAMKSWTGAVMVPIGNANLHEALGSISGPLSKSLTIGIGFGYDGRDGFTTNNITGHKLDSRSASFGKGQVLWTPSKWDIRIIGAGERARDGDYALNDLAALRQNPYVASRDFEGSTSRDVYSGTVIARHEGKSVSFTSTTGYVRWNTHDSTDLDYSPLPLATRDNTERDRQFTQEVRFASVAPAKVSGSTTFRWQAGAFFMDQHYTQDAVNTIAAGLISPFILFPVAQHSPQATLDDNGFSVYGQGTLSFHRKVDLTVGVRADRENKTAALNSFYDPAIAPPTVVNQKKSFTDVSPQFAAAFDVGHNAMLYASTGRGFKAGGFNPASPAGQEQYGQEHAWHTEGGVKKSTSTGSLTLNVAGFLVEWSNLQVNQPNPQVPGQFYISNAGNARTSGVEVEFGARPHKGVELFASTGSTSAVFKAGNQSGGVDVSGKTISNTPSFTFMAGTQLSHAMSKATSLYARAEVVTTGAFKYDDANTAGQSTYTVGNFRGGVRAKRVFIEAWMKNAFNTTYIPLAFAYATFAPSGFIGEMGRPRTFGVRGGVSF